jgi:hypothetical protein
MYRNPKVKVSPWESIMPPTAIGSYLSLLPVGSPALYELSVIERCAVGPVVYKSCEGSVSWIGL